MVIHEMSNRKPLGYRFAAKLTATGRVKTGAPGEGAETRLYLWEIPEIKAFRLELEDPETLLEGHEVALLVALYGGDVLIPANLLL